MQSDLQSQLVLKMDETKGSKPDGHSLQTDCVAASI